MNITGATATITVSSADGVFRLLRVTRIPGATPPPFAIAVPQPKPLTFVRWSFSNPRTRLAYEFPINPNDMTSPHAARGTTGHTVSPVDLQVRTYRPTREPIAWQFSGVIRTKEHHDALRDWCASPDLIRLTDHLKRVWQVRLFSFEPAERRPTPHAPWRFHYTVHAYVYRRLQ